MTTIDAPCPHGGHLANCGPCLNDAVDEYATLAELEESMDEEVTA